MTHPPGADEKDRRDKLHGDGDATLERDRNLAGLDQEGKYKQAPGDDSADRRQYQPGQEVQRNSDCLALCHSWAKSLEN